VHAVLYIGLCDDVETMKISAKENTLKNYAVAETTVQRVNE